MTSHDESPAVIVAQKWCRPCGWFSCYVAGAVLWAISACAILVWLLIHEQWSIMTLAFLFLALSCYLMVTITLFCQSGVVAIDPPQSTERKDRQALEQIT